MSISARQFKQLLEQQKAMQETNERIVRLLENQQEQQSLLRRQDRKIPRELSVSSSALAVKICSLPLIIEPVHFLR